jgi:hypothetical protein
VTSSVELTDAEVFQPLTREWVDAYNLKDAGRLAAFYDENASYISAHVAGLIAHGGGKQFRRIFRKG